MAMRKRKNFQENGDEECKRTRPPFGWRSSPIGPPLLVVRSFGFVKALHVRIGFTAESAVYRRWRRAEEEATRTEQLHIWPPSRDFPTVSRLAPPTRRLTALTSGRPTASASVLLLNESRERVS
ncbi:hypothetical protein Q1695_011981 [Nippostrongylus brasiliensis]|nr:hypothetical protein Q1695_011981 [Nippostrongylus brasiliensis]